MSKGAVRHAIHLQGMPVGARHQHHKCTCRTCLLGPDTNTTTLCVYAYFIAGVSILATIIVSIFLVRCAALCYDTCILVHGLARA